MRLLIAVLLADMVATGKIEVTAQNETTRMVVGSGRVFHVFHNRPDSSATIWVELTAEVNEWFVPWLQRHQVSYTIRPVYTHDDFIAQETMSVQEVWLAAGGNPGITATRAETIEALHQLDEVCDHCAEQHKGHAVLLNALHSIHGIMQCPQSILNIIREIPDDIWNQERV